MDAPETTDDSATDYNALDNTLGGQAAQAAFILAYYAAGDLTRGTGLTRAGLAAANLALVAAFNAFDEDPANDLTTVLRERGEGTAGPAATWAALGGVAGVAVGAAVVGARLHRAAARWLSRRGVGAPWTLMGVVAAGGYLAAKALPSGR
ncbi:hypothetical protein [Corynebacterium timonense]|uniref:Uncharacterized protein n=1 Tax=Corynebacterium timonense TaxID=441500 RepID=A0A1H1TU37_9CORY|nr:hypothetical protein [Corynebacterium timonense]SDS63718.1 hypothetical protein SAMN04488539_2075 [Corynebacterium timonense]